MASYEFKPEQTGPVRGYRINLTRVPMIIFVSGMTCPTCLGLIQDWLCLPETGLPRWKQISEHSIEVSRALYYVVMRPSREERESIERMFRAWIKTDIFSEQRAGAIMMNLIRSFGGKENLDALIALLETRYSTNAGVVERWAATWIVRLWKTVHVIHLEHTGQQELSECSVPGLRRALRVTNGPIVMVNPSYVAGIISNPTP